MTDLTSLACIGWAYWKITQKTQSFFLFFWNIGTEKHYYWTIVESLKLIEADHDLFSLLNEYIGMLYKDRSTTRLYLVKNPVQNLESDYCGVIQLYFYHHLFGLNNDRKILDHENLSKNTVELLNELFSLD